MLVSTNPDPETLVRNYQAGDVAALEDLYRLYFDPLYRWVHMRVGNVDNAQDVTSDTWMRVASSLHKYTYRDGSAGFVGWLYQIARNLIRDHYRDQAKRNETPTGDLISFDRIASGNDVTERCEQRETFVNALGHLSGKEKQVVALRLYAGLSVNDTAKVLDCTPEAVTQRQWRAANRLRRAIPAQARPHTTESLAVALDSVTRP